jgi:putative transposase
VLEGLRGEDSIAERCRREGIATSMYYGWSKDFLKAGKRRLAGDTARARRHLRRGARAAPRGRRPEGGCGRPHLGKPPAEKKHERGWKGRGMRYPASEKLEIIRLVEPSHLPVRRRALEKLGIARATFYRWCDLHQRPAGPRRWATDRSPRPGRVWNRLPEEIRKQEVITLALEEPELSPRELAVRFTDERRAVLRLKGGNGLPPAQGAGSSDHQPG